MRILGLGVDIININRIKMILNRNKKFVEKIFSKKEILYCNKKKAKEFCFAKRFAAKEAFSKALGTGISKGLNFKEIEVIKEDSGKPSLSIKGKSLLVVKKTLKKDNFVVFLSISDDKPFAVATVIIAH
ncbi:MAG: hypothetical protein CBE47_04075 [Pelagibacteraceae bacterium TMED287]|nr:MAG: hypothetical protein CBE47_04075 [Pelagibacteraceae bacterium TMED287]|tara:strand:+ start:1310 stop:1696 length:387 start_codon:yes stop_codon:yes gene_type:complete